MEQRIDDGLSPYRIYSRADWAALRDDTPMTLTPDEVAQLRSLHDRLDMAEVEEIYLPLSRLLSLYVAATQRLHKRAAALPRQRGRKDAVHHRRRGFGRGRQVDHRARAASLADALDQRAQGRARHHRRLPAAERGSCRAKA